MAIDPDKLTAVILAGGYGTRLGARMGNLPKPMAPVCGRPFIDWVILFLSRQGIRRFVIASGYRGEAIEAHLEGRPFPELEIVCYREKEPRGTAGGFLEAVERSGFSPSGWLVVNGDSLLLGDFSKLFRLLEERRWRGGILGIELPDASRYGTLACDTEGRLTAFHEKQPGEGLVNAGVYLFEHSLLACFPDRSPLSFEEEVFPALIDSGIGLRVIAETGAFIDIGTPEMLAAADDFIEGNRGHFS